MFYLQRSFNSQCVPVTEELWYEIVNDPQIDKLCHNIATTTDIMRGYEKGSELYNKWHDAKASDKKKLPSFVFMAGRIEQSARGSAMGCWRKQEHIFLNGLVMADFDDLDEPRKVYAEHVSKMTEFKDSILLAHVTPSGHGLRFVFKANPEIGNIADNQLAFAKAIGLELDGVCKDSSRLSFAVCSKNIIQVRLKELINYENKEFDERFGDDYRRNCSNPRNSNDRINNDAIVRNSRLDDEQNNGTVAVSSAKVYLENFPKNDKGEYLYGNTTYKRIVDELISSYGGAPIVGRRNDFYYDLARKEMRYLCDFNEDLMFAVMPDFGLPETERRQALRSALNSRRYSLSARCRRVLDSLCIREFNDDGNQKSKRTASFNHEQLFQTFKPFFGGPWAPALNALDDKVKLAGFLAAGAMFGTYLSPVKLTNFYDGNDWRLSFMVYIIGQAASGKGVFVELNKLIMEPLRLLDEQGRKWEEKYKEDKEMRNTSSKAQKADAMQIEHFPIRVLPGTISNAMRYKRMKDAVQIINGAEVHLHCYIFESELSAKLRSEQGTWAGAQDLDCKSFSNEFGGNDYGNSQAVNGLIEVNMNQVITGTQDAMNRKITPRNCLDGLATRLVMFEMPDNSFVMLNRKKVRRSMEEQKQLRTIGNELMKCSASVNLEQNVKVPVAYQNDFGKTTSLSNALYEWGVKEAKRCAETEDVCADYFRRRAPIIAVRYAVVDAILRDLYHFQQTGSLKITFNSVLLAVKLASYIQESQMYFFGGKIIDALDDVEKNFVPEAKRISKRADYFQKLQKEFTKEDLIKVMPESTADHTVVNILSQWKKNKYVKQKKVNNQIIYVKLVNII